MPSRLLIIGTILALRPLFILSRNNATDDALEGFIRDSTAGSIPAAKVQCVIE